MGRSAKFHKRQDKKKTSSAGISAAAQPPLQPAPKTKPNTISTIAAPTPKEQKKRAGLKAKAKAIQHKRESEDGPVLGGADYAELMLGGRRRAAVEAAKLPKDPDSSSS